MTKSTSGAPPLATVVWLLGLTQIVGYGTLYYGFAILSGAMARDFGWPQSWIYGAFSVALFAGGLVAPVAGRRIDRHGAGRTMAWGTVAATAALLLVAAAPSPAAFVAALIAVELAGPFVLYDAAFACIVQFAGGDARRRITHLTLIAGFASTLFWPLTALLHDHMSWRAVLGLFAIANLAACLPAHLWLARLARTHDSAAVATAPAVGAPPEAAVPAERRGLVMLLVTLGFAVGGFLLSGVLAQLVPMLTAVGLGEAAVAVSTLFGPAQVLVRFVNMTAGAGRHPITITLLASALMPAGVLVLAATAPAYAGAAVFAVLLGFGSGLTSIVRGTLPLVLFGATAYGERLGRMASVRLGLTAAAPFVLAALIDSFGTTAALAVMIATGLVAFAAFLAVAHLAVGRAGSLVRRVRDL